MFVNKRQQIPQPRQTKITGRGPKPTLRQAPSSFGSGSIGKAAATEREVKKTLDWDDISLSSEDSKSFERFLKKKSSDDDSDKRKGKKEQKKKDVIRPGSSFERPKTSRGVSETIPKPQMSSSGALNRLAMLEAKMKTRQEIHSQNKVSLSGSDFDLDLSSDMEIKREMGRTNERLRKSLEKLTMKKTTEKGQSIFLTLDENSESSQEDTNARKRFLKSFMTPELAEHSDSQQFENEDEQERKGFPRKDQDVFKVHGSTDFDESEVSLQTYMRSFDKDKESKKSGSSKKVTFASDLIRSSDLEQSLDDFMPPSDRSDEPSSLDEVIPSKIHNVMSLDDLLPSQELDLDQNEENRPTSALGFVGLHSVEELVPAASDVRSSSEYVPSMSEEIHEASDKSSDQSSSDGPINVLQNLRSVDDIQASDSEPELKITSTPTQLQPNGSDVFKAKAAVESESEEIKSESENYTEDFHSDDDTLKDTESITHDVSKGSHSSSSIPEEDSRDSRDSSTSYSSSSTYSESSVSSSSTTVTRTPPSIKRNPKKVQSTEVQTDIAAGTWLPAGSVYADTSAFKPTRLIDNEALDVLTSYNPASLAIQDLLKQQLTLTRNFVARSRRLRDLAESSIPCDYVYGEINEEGLKRLKQIWFNEENASVSAFNEKNASVSAT